MRHAETQRRGRPLLFLGAVVLGWTGLRVAMGTLDFAEPQTFASAGLAQGDSEALPLATLDGVSTDAETASTDKSAEAKEQQAAAELPAPSIDERPLPPQLDAPPPAHLMADPIPLPAASTHNSLWMSASQSEPLMPPGSDGNTLPKDGGD